MHGSSKIQVLKLIQLARKSLTLGVFMTCMEMYGNGAKTSGMIIMRGLLQTKELGKVETAIPVFFAVAAGAATQGHVDRRIEVGSFQATSTIPSASAS